MPPSSPKVPCKVEKTTSCAGSSSGGKASASTFTNRVGQTRASAAAEAAPEEQAIQQAEGLTREQELAQKDLGTLRALVAAAGGEPITGSGAKARMVEWLIANTQ
jgi:hypothetical protein